MLIRDVRRTIVVLMLWTLAGCGISKELHRTFPLTGDGNVVLENATGGATISAWDYDEIKVDAVTRARHGKRLQEAEVRFDAQPASIRVWTEYIATDPEATVPLARNQRATVHYDLTVPRYASLERIRIVDSNLVIRGVRGNIQAIVKNGSIRATVDRLEAGAIALEAQGGDIVVTIPERADVRLEARARNGTISSMLGIPMRSALPGGGIESHLEGIFGTGASRIRLSTTGGDIEIRTTPRS